MAGGFAIIEGLGRTVRVEYSFRWANHGKPILVKTLKEADVIKAEIGRLAREFVDDFFRCVPQE